ncbi:hypothetical protein BJ508DRAFT_329309 [Ascobolus immersus RN42]|uniref:F-box domain-containing protein n=1 Tax=Ascobolus immersus RN42 TaxID=1160509 RepID=A0A3N4HYV6_ASCIM|nr:hypothetical protein BJ508DRAFT_329309 [Ascobolus immersus RN42]
MGESAYSFFKRKRTESQSSPSITPSQPASKRRKTTPPAPTPPAPTPPKHPFHTLPVDLRLEIYSHCSTFTLLQLLHSSRPLFTDLTTYPSILRTSFGFHDCAAAAASSSSSSPVHLTTWPPESFVSPSPLAPGSHFNICCVSSFGSESERRLFHRQHHDSFYAEVEDTCQRCLSLLWRRGNRQACVKRRAGATVKACATGRSVVHCRGCNGHLEVDVWGEGGERCYQAGVARRQVGAVVVPAGTGTAAGSVA